MQTGVEFLGLKNQVGKIIMSFVNHSVSDLVTIVRNGYIANTWRGAVMIAAQKDGYKVKITDINKVMT